MNIRKHIPTPEELEEIERSRVVSERLHKAKDIAESYISLLGRKELGDTLKDLGWRFKWLHSKGLYGKCFLRSKVIGISKHLAGLNRIEDTIETILHEVAHALRGMEKDKDGRWLFHDDKWREIAIGLGGSGERCYKSEIITPEKKWKGKCKRCGKEILRHRRVKGLACSRCVKGVNGGKWSKEFMFVWEENKR